MGGTSMHPLASDSGRAADCVPSYIGVPRQQHGNKYGKWAYFPNSRKPLTWHFRGVQISVWVLTCGQGVRSAGRCIARRKHCCPRNAQPAGAPACGKHPPGSCRANGSAGCRWLDQTEGF